MLRILRYVPLKFFQDIFNANEVSIAILVPLFPTTDGVSQYILQGAESAVKMARSRHGEQNTFARVIEESEKSKDTLNIAFDDMDVKVEAGHSVTWREDLITNTITLRL